MRKVIFLIAFTLCFIGTTNAQFLQRLGNKIEAAAEKAIERKVEEKVTKETEEVFDSTFNQDKKTEQEKLGKSGMTKVSPAANYAFNHKAEMQIKNGKEVMKVDYFLPDYGNFLCAQIKDEKVEGDFYTVFDIDKEAMFTYMENEGQKIKMSVAFKVDDTNEQSKVDIKATGNTKTILGYKCQEYKMTGEDMTGTIWVTKEVDIRFPSSFYSVKQNKSNNQEWMRDLDGWAMEMEMIDTSKRKPQTITMNCLSIEQSNLKINSNDYQSLGSY